MASKSANLSSGGYIEIEAGDGSGAFSTYVTGPEEVERGVVVIQEIFGINATMRAAADRFAQIGYRAAVPDLFWRLEPGIELDSTQESGRERAFEFYHAFDLDKGVDDCITAIAHLRQGCARVGAVGFCLGGRIAYQLAASSDAEACVGYYGVGIETALDLAAGEMRPLLLHFGETDGLCGPEAQDQIYRVLEGKPNVELHTYAGAGHAFARPNSVNFHAEAAALAKRRTADFLARLLR